MEEKFVESNKRKYEIVRFRCNCLSGVPEKLNMCSSLQWSNRDAFLPEVALIMSFH